MERETNTVSKNVWGLKNTGILYFMIFFNLQWKYLKLARNGTFLRFNICDHSFDRTNTQ